jgi:hypothetical protein
MISSLLLEHIGIMEFLFGHIIGYNKINMIKLSFILKPPSLGALTTIID